MLEVKVLDRDIEKAIRDMKRQLQKDGLFKDMKRRAYYEKPSVKEKRKRIEAGKKRMKAMRARKQRNDRG